MVVVMNMMNMMNMMMMAIAEKFDTAATIAYANEEIREILHRMEGSLQITNKDEQSTMIQAFKILYPQVTWQEFYEMGETKCLPFRFSETWRSPSNSLVHVYAL
jgi:hypothetical protein